VQETISVEHVESGDRGWVMPQQVELGFTERLESSPSAALIAAREMLELPPFLPDLLCVLRSNYEP
jgi:hypothetical protein